MLSTNLVISINILQFKIKLKRIENKEDFLPTCIKFISLPTYLQFYILCNTTYVTYTNKDILMCI